MIFKLQYLVSSLWPWNKLRYSLRTPGQAIIEIEPAKPELQPHNAYFRDTLATILLTRSPKPEIQDGLRAIADRELPRGCDLSKAGNMHVPLDTDGRLLPNHGIPIDVLPQKLVSFCNQVYSEANVALDLVESFHRWRFDLAGPYINRHPHRSMYSFDEKNWDHIPGGALVIIGGVCHSPEPLSVEQQAEIENQLNQPLVVPVSDTLIRDAWKIHNESPRGGLMLGIAALEVGLKEFIAGKCADARWLADNVPSPPVMRILQEYVPALAGAIVKDHPIPKEILDELRDGVQIRNRIAHVGASIDYDKLRRVLAAVRRALRFLDVYQGRTWALAYTCAGHSVLES
jgi:hypothetical protein